MTAKEKAQWFIANPAALARALGYDDIKDELHGKWLRKMLYATEDMTLQAHRGSYKTTCLCCAIAMFMMWQPDKNIIFMRKTDADVSEVIRNVSRIFTTDIMRELYYALTGGSLTMVKETTSEITLSTYSAPRGSSQLMGIGIGGSLTGKHADLVITDDIVNLRDRVSRSERERTKLVYQELQNLKNRGGRIINTGTPWHVEDAFTIMPEAEKYDCYTSGLLSKEEIAELKTKMSPSLFAANYELQHIAAENALFTTAPTYATDEIAQEELKHANATAPELLFDGIAHIDAAYGGEDYTAFTCGKRRGDKLYMFGKMWHGHVDTIIDYAISECQRLRCAPIHLEVNADKGFVAREIIRRGYKASVYSEPENKYVKISTYLRKWWNNIVWLEGTDPEYINQILDYTQDAEHDDAPDSAACVCRYYDNRKK